MAWSHGHGKMSPHYWDRIKHLESKNEEVELQVEAESKEEKAARRAARMKRMAGSTAAAREKLSVTGQKKLGLKPTSLSAKQAGKTETKPPRKAVAAHDQSSKEGRLATIKAAAEKARLKKAAAMSRAQWGGEGHGGFQMPGSSFRRYSEETEK
jgi:hypothetical protein